MSRRRLHLPAAWGLDAERSGGLDVEGEAFHYLARVLRLTVGQELWLFDGQGRSRLATIAERSEDRLELRLGPSSRQASEPSTRTLLLMGLTRGPSMDRSLRMITELGLDEVWPVICGRSVAVPGPQKRAERRRRWQRITEEAARQCGRSRVCEVGELLSLGERLSRLKDDPERWGLRLVASPTSAAGLPDTLGPGAPDTALLVGPEGGLSEEELELAAGAGFLSFGLGSLVLRAETAAPVVLALARYRLGALA